MSMDGYKRDYPFLYELMQWYNKRANYLQPKFKYLHSAEQVISGCGEGTCQWEDLIIGGITTEGKCDTVTLSNTSVIDFFRSLK